jgi:hypothetical protein
VATVLECKFIIETLFPAIVAGFLLALMTQKSLLLIVYHQQAVHE